MRLSESGLALLREFEGFRANAYPDPGSRDGKPVTIGYGSTRYADGRPIQLGDVITREQADELLRREVAETETAVAGLVKVPLTQTQFDALVSFAFNVGIGALTRSTLLRLLNAGDYAGAADQLLRWDKNDGRVMSGLTARRYRERAMFLMGPQSSPSDTRPNDAFAGFDLPNLHTAPPSLPTADKPAKNGIKPMAPLIPALIGLLTSVAPDLIRLFSDKDKPVSERNTEAAIKVLDIAKKVAESPTPAAAVEAIVADGAKAEAFREALRVHWYELSPGDGGGVTGARQAAKEAVERPGMAGVIAAVNQFAMDAAVLGGGGWIMYSVIMAEGISNEIRTLILGSVAGYIAAVIQFRYGSSVSSRVKDNALVDQLGKR